MTKYECLFALSTKTLDEEAINATSEKIQKVITDNGGVIENVDVWGKRRLAYTVNYENEGFYTLINFEADAKLPAELERILNITTGVLRCGIFKR